MKTGLLKKFWKLIVVAFIGIAGAVKRAVAGISRRREASNQRSNV